MYIHIHTLGLGAVNGDTPSAVATVSGEAWASLGCWGDFVKYWAPSEGAFKGRHKIGLGMAEATWMFGGLSRVSNGPFGACKGFLGGLTWDTSWTY